MDKMMLHFIAPKLTIIAEFHIVGPQPKSTCLWSKIKFEM